jgi:hypothetical protein
MDPWAPSPRIFFFRGKALALDLGRGPQRQVDFVPNSRQAPVDELLKIFFEV